MAAAAKFALKMIVMVLILLLPFSLGSPAPSNEHAGPAPSSLPRKMAAPKPRTMEAASPNKAVAVTASPSQPPSIPDVEDYDGDLNGTTEPNGEDNNSEWTVGDYIVGSWTLPSDQADFIYWALDKEFVVGDTLIFNFITGIHDVAEVTKSSYDTCDTSSSDAILSKQTAGPATIKLTTPGHHFFVCTIGAHCSLGLKLDVNVVASRPQSPPPTQSSGATVPPPRANSIPTTSSGATVPPPRANNIPTTSSGAPVPPPRANNIPTTSSGATVPPLRANNIPTTSSSAPSFGSSSSALLTALFSLVAFVILF